MDTQTMYVPVSFLLKASAIKELTDSEELFMEAVRASKKVVRRCHRRVALPSFLPSFCCIPLPTARLQLLCLLLVSNVIIPHLLISNVIIPHDAYTTHTNNPVHACPGAG